MAQRNDRAEKRIVEVDSERLSGLVAVAEMTLEKAVLEVPEFDRIRKIQNGVRSIPTMNPTYKLAAETNTEQLLSDWFFNNEDHEAVMHRTDGPGQIFSSLLLPAAEMLSYGLPAYDAASPTFAQISTIWAPWDFTPVFV